MKGWKKRMAKAVARQPNHLRTVIIAKPKRPRIRGTFGPASAVTHIKPESP